MHKRHLLVIDDEESVIKTLKEALEMRIGANYHVTGCKDLELALDFMKKENPDFSKRNVDCIDLIILDGVLPISGNGSNLFWNIFKRIRSETGYKGKALVLTGWIPDDIPQEAFDVFLAVIQKGSSLRPVCTFIHAYLDLLKHSWK